MAEKVSLRRSLLLLFMGLLLVGVLVVGWVWRPWHCPAVTITISFSTDEQGPLEVYRKKAIFTRWRHADPLTANIDIGEWEGELLRLDIRGENEQERSTTSSEVLVACSAQLIPTTGAAEPIEFVGWKNDGSLHFHPGPLGSPAFTVPGETDPPFVYSEEGLLWYVLRVPEKAKLQISFKPVLRKALEGKTEPFVSNLRPGWTPRRKSPYTKTEQPPDVFIYLIDALRADHLGCYGYSRGTSPNIDEFTRQATLYERAYTASTWTSPSVATLLTGLYPSAHGLVHIKSDKLADWPVLQAEILQESGHKTCFITTNGVVRQYFGFHQGIDVFILKRMETWNWANSQVAGFLAAQKPEQPVWVYVHTIEPHSPYVPAPETLQRFDRGFRGTCDGSREALHKAGNFDPNLSADDLEHLIDLYDGEVFDSDTGFGEFLKLLKRSGRFENALIILVADHGEAFAEHDIIQHGNNLNREQMQVPLIIKFPAGRHAGLRVKERVSLVDIFPTVMAQASVKPELEYRLAGVDLARVASGSESDSSRRIYAQLSPFEDNSLDLLAVIDEEGFKRVLSMSEGPQAKLTDKSVGLWNLNSDPDEQVDLAEALPVRVAYNEQMIAQWLMQQTHLRPTTFDTASTVEMTEEVEKDLRALGYLQ